MDLDQDEQIQAYANILKLLKFNSILNFFYILNFLYLINLLMFNNILAK